MNDLISRKELEEELAAYEKETGDDLGAVYNILQKLAFANKGTAGDLISRQAALDAFGLSEKTRKYGGDRSGYDTRMLYEIQDALEALPSAQPEQRRIPCSERFAI